MPVAWVQSRHHNYKINPEPAPPPPAPGVSNGSIPIEPFGNTWNRLESLVAELGRTPPGKELDAKRRGPLQEQWVAICKRYPLISFKEKDFMARSSKR